MSHTAPSTFAACVASIVGAVPADVPLAGAGEDPADAVRPWLGQRGLGLVPVADPGTFSWAGPWIALRGGRWVVMFGVPSGVLWDPAGAPEAEAAIDAGWVVAPLDVGLWRAPPAGDPGAGRVEVIVIGPEACHALAEVAEVRALAGQGLEGDRYAAGRGTFGSGRPGSALTLVAAEVLDELGIDGVAARRNIVTRGIDVNALVGRRFRVGEAVCEGRRLCEPCAHLDRLSGPGLLRPLVHRGGLRADIVSAGVIRAGDPVVAVDG